MFYFLDKTFWNDPVLVGRFIITLSAIIFLRYLVFSFFYQTILGFFKKGYASLSRIKKWQVRREVRWSLLSSLLFAVFSAFCFWMFQQGWTKIYTDMTEYGWLYFFISPLLLIGIYETYYYWLHRWMHLPSVFKVVHKVHHQSIEPTVFTSFSFHPLESVAQLLFFPLFLYFIPIHFIMLFAMLMMMTLSAIVNHSGVEILHQKFALRNFISSSHHELHHSEFKTNFGLHFTWWDKVMKTESKNQASSSR